MLLKLNRNQKIVLAIGIISLIILVVTTPRFYMAGEVPRRVYGESGKQLDLGEAFFRLAVVVLVTGGLIVLLRDSKKG